MPNKDTTGYKQVAQATLDLIDHKQTPNVLSDAILETLIEMSADSKVSIWHEETGLSVASLAALFSVYKRGAGYRRVRLYGAYEAGRIHRTRKRKGLTK